MSDTFDHSGLPEDELLAAEYALGVLDGVDRAAAEQRIARDRLCASGRGLGTAARTVGRGNSRNASAAAGLGSHCRRPARASRRAPVCGIALRFGGD